MESDGRPRNIAERDCAPRPLGAASTRGPQGGAAVLPTRVAIDAVNLGSLAGDLLFEQPEPPAGIIRLQETAERFDRSRHATFVHLHRYQPQPNGVLIGELLRR